MSTQVRVIGDEQGRAIRLNNNPDYGYIVIKQTQTEFDDNGWISDKTRTALIKGQIDTLEKLKFKADQELPGRIVVWEDLKSYNNQPEREQKYAGKTGVPCLLDDQPIYRKTFYDKTGLKPDQFIAHNNKEEILAAQLLDKRVKVSLDD